MSDEKIIEERTLHLKIKSTVAQYTILEIMFNIMINSISIKDSDTPEDSDLILEYLNFIDTLPDEIKESYQQEGYEASKRCLLALDILNQLFGGKKLKDDEENPWWEEQPPER